MAVRANFTNIERNEIRRKFAKLSGKNKVDAKAFRRLTVLHMRLKGFLNSDIADATGFSESYITELVGKFKKHGMDSIIIDRRTSNNRRMTLAQEAKFLEQFEEIAEEGLIITVENILRKFEEVTGETSSTSTIYDLLKRHGWRKVKPRPRHPGCATEEEMTSSKKLTNFTNKSYWKKIEGTGAIK